jgi:16S rRNA A1518/A1519 N6-dimethyltransferase RsmA/KsgA/DIM1 with predicted DNA glycosylase/AP lyase activity
MAEKFSYPGKELELFSNAIHWKQYMTSFINPHIKGRVLEVGAGLGTMTRWMNNSPFQEWILLEPDPAMAALLQEMQCNKWHHCRHRCWFV